MSLIINGLSGHSIPTLSSSFREVLVTRDPVTGAGTITQDPEAGTHHSDLPDYSKSRKLLEVKREVEPKTGFEESSYGLCGERRWGCCLLLRVCM